MASGMGMGSGGFHRMNFGGDDVAKPKITKKLLGRIFKYFMNYWKQIFLMIAAIAVSSVLGLVPPLLTKNIIDHALPEKNMQLLGILTLTSFLATLTLGFLSVGESYLNTWVSKRIIYDIRNQMYKHLEYMSLRFFSSVKTGEITSRINNDIGGIESVFHNTVSHILQNSFVLIATTIALFSMNWKLAILGMFVLPLFVIPTRQVGKTRWKITAQAQAKLGELNHIIQETLNVSGSVLLKIFTREKDEYEKFRQINEDVAKLQLKESLAGRWFFMIVRIFSSIGPVLIYFYGGYLFISGEISVGSIVAFVALLQRLYGPATQLSNIHIDITRSLALFERIFDYLDREHEIRDLPNATALPPVKGLVEFKDVNFSYNDQQETLKDINFSVQPGQMVALVGPSGAGKTTITYLLPRLYDTVSGNICIDSKDVREVTLQSLRSQIGMVTQDTYLLNATIRENLLFAKKDATEEEIINACKLACIHDFIVSQPDGYDTVVGERGIKLSGGEKQRISIARAILKNPAIIIFDEATSSLDSMSEALIQQAIEPLLKNRTSFVIAHRLSTILSADKILVIENGRVVESGTHEELLAVNGMYKSLYDRQFKVGMAV